MRNKVEFSFVKSKVWEMVMMHKPKSEIIDWLVNDQGYTNKSAEGVYYKACNDNKEYYERYCTNAIKENTDKLLNIINKSYDQGRFKDALSGIKILVDMMPKKVTRSTDDNNEEITITFE